MIGAVGIRAVGIRAVGIRAVGIRAVGIRAIGIVAIWCTTLERECKTICHPLGTTPTVAGRVLHAECAARTDGCIDAAQEWGTTRDVGAVVACEGPADFTWVQSCTHHNVAVGRRR